MSDLSQKIYEKLREITVFDPEFKQEVYDKLSTLSEEKLLEADRILSEVLLWEQTKKENTQSAISAEASFLAEKDQEKIEEIKKLISNL